MIINDDQMFSVELTLLKADESYPFPLFLFLKRNKKYVPLRKINDKINSNKYKQLESKPIKLLWIPINYKEAFELFFKEKEKPTKENVVEEAKEPTETTEEVNKKLELVEGEQNEAGVFEETEIVRDVLQDETLSKEAKAEILSSLGQDLLRSFNQISNRGEEARKEGLKRGRQIADEILAIAAMESNIYDEILALRSSKQDIEHSIIVSTMSVMYGLALGYSDHMLLAEIATAGLFHDIGLVKVDPMILGKNECDWSAMEIQEYQSHIEASVEILEEANADFEPNIINMVRQHHENYDGSGFPLQLKGADIAEYSQVLHLANWFDRLASGKIDGNALSPIDCFDHIQENTVKADTIKEVQPELLQRIFQFMLEEKEAAERVLREAEARTEEITKTQLA